MAMTDVADADLEALEADAADDADEGGEEQAEGGKKRRLSKKLLIIIGAAMLVLAAGGAAAFFLLGSGGGEAAKDPLVRESFYYDIPQMTVNLNPEGDREQYLKLDIALELADKEMVEQIEPKMPRVLDAFQVYLRELRKSDLEGSAGIYQLKEELRRRVNIAVYPAEVDRILFKELLIQ
jgi:flagellar FliL protein